jgi:hypothetical protein
VSDNTRRNKLAQRLDEIEATIVELHDQIREARTLAAGENPVGHVIAFWVGFRIGAGAPLIEQL